MADHRRLRPGLGALGRVVEYDVRGTGLSERVGASDLASAEDHARDAVAVMDAAGFSAPVVIADASSAPIGVQLAVSHRQRVDRLVLLCPNFRGSLSDELVPIVLDAIESSWGEPLFTETFFPGLASDPRFVSWYWGEPLFTETFFPGLASDPRFVSWYSRHLRLSATPSAARALVAIDQQTDVTDLLPRITCPTLVVGHQDDAVLAPDDLERQSAPIPDRIFVITPGGEHTYGVGVGDAEALDAIRRFVGVPTEVGTSPHEVTRSILFTDIIESTSHLAVVGDRTWRTILDAHDRRLAEIVADFGGEVVHTTGDGVLAMFEDTTPHGTHALKGCPEPLALVSVELAGPD